VEVELTWQTRCSRWGCRTWTLPCRGWTHQTDAMLLMGDVKLGLSLVEVELTRQTLCSRWGCRTWTLPCRGWTHQTDAMLLMGDVNLGLSLVEVELTWQTRCSRWGCQTWTLPCGGWRSIFSYSTCSTALSMALHTVEQDHYTFVYINLFKVNCEASYPNLYLSLSTAHSRWNPSHFVMRFENAEC